MQIENAAKMPGARAVKSALKTMAYTESQILEQFPFAGRLDSDYVIVLFKDELEQSEWARDCQEEGFHVDQLCKTYDFTPLTSNSTNQFMLYEDFGELIDILEEEEEYPE